MEKSEKGKRAKARRELYERLAHASYHAAMDKTKPLELRQYYAGISLYYDNKAKA